MTPCDSACFAVREVPVSVVCLGCVTMLCFTLCTTTRRHVRTAVLMLVTWRPSLSLDEAACWHCESTRTRPCRPCPVVFQVVIVPPNCCLSCPSLRSTMTLCLCRVSAACLQPSITLSHTSTTAREPPLHGSHSCQCAVDAVARQCSWDPCLEHAPCVRLGCPSGRRGPHRCCSAGCTRGPVHRHQRQHVERQDRLGEPRHRQRPV